MEQDDLMEGLQFETESDPMYYWVMNPTQVEGVPVMLNSASADSGVDSNQLVFSPLENVMLNDVSWAPPNNLASTVGDTNYSLEINNDMSMSLASDNNPDQLHSEANNCKENSGGRRAATADSTKEKTKRHPMTRSLPNSTINNTTDDGEMSSQEEDVGRIKTIKANQNRKGKPKRDCTKQDDIHKFECKMCKKFFTKKGLEVHNRDAHREPRCCYCKNQMLKSTLDWHLKENRCTKMPPEVKAQKQKARPCPSATTDKSCKFSHKFWKKLVDHLQEVHPDFKDEEFFKPPTSEQDAKFRKTHKGKLRTTQSSTSTNNVTSETPKSSCSDLTFPKQFNFSIIPEGTVLKPLDVKIEKPPSTSPKCMHLKLGSWGYLRIFPLFVDMFYKSGLAESGGVLVSVANSKLTKKEKFLDRLKTTILPLVNFQKVSKSYMNDTVHVISNEKKEKNISIAAFEETSTTNPPDQSFVDLFNDAMHNLKIRLKKTKNYYASDVDASLFEVNHDGWNLSDLENDLNNTRMFRLEYANGEVISLDAGGIQTPYIYVGKYCTIFTLHKEDGVLGGVSYLHSGAPKVWIIIPPAFAAKLEEKLAQACPTEYAKCNGFLKHKGIFVGLEALNNWEIPYSVVFQPPNTYIVLASNAYHQGINLGFNVSEAVNYLTKEVLADYKMDPYECFCDYNPTHLPRDNFVAKHQPDRYDAFMNGQDLDKFPHMNGEAIALNDNARAIHYFKQHIEWRNKNKGVNPKTGIAYGKDDEIDYELLTKWTKAINEADNDVSDQDVNIPKRAKRDNRVLLTSNKPISTKSKKRKMMSHK